MTTEEVDDPGYARRRTSRPPPGWMETPRPWEGHVLAANYSRIRAAASTIRNGYRIGQAREDSAQEVALAVSLALRRYAWEYEDAPPTSALLGTIIRRKVRHIIRATNSEYRKWQGRDTRSRGEDGEDYEPDIPDPDGVDPEAAVAYAQYDDAARALVYAVRRQVPPSVFGILHLRFVEELTPAEIADCVGYEGTPGEKARRTSSRISRAVAIANEAARMAGVSSTLQLSHLAAGDWDAEELDGNL